MRSVSAYSSIVNSARASYLRRESHSGANTRVLRCYSNALIITRLCRFVCQTGFSYVAKRSFLHRGRASSAPPKSLSGSAVWAFPHRMRVRKSLFGHCRRVAAECLCRFHTFIGILPFLFWEKALSKYFTSCLHKYTFSKCRHDCARRVFLAAYGLLSEARRRWVRDAGKFH